jgi:hypothetical protein
MIFRPVISRTSPCVDRCLMCFVLILGGLRSASAAEPVTSNRFFFTSQGKTGIVHSDGSALRYFNFDVHGQATWQPGPIFSDGRRVIFLSMEPRRDGPGKPFEIYFTQTPTHIWVHDLVQGSLAELCTKDRIAPFETPSLLVSDERLLMQVVKDGVGRVVSMKLDGSDPRDFTKAGEGLPYAFSLSPDGKRVAFHLAGGRGYEVMTCDVDGGNRVKLAGAAGHLYFGPCWSPTGDWVAYLDCQPGTDPAHDWGDVCIGRPDGSEHRVLTKDGAMWFGASYGPANAPEGGSNLLTWTHDGALLFPRRIPGSKVPWEYNPGRRNVDHFNRDFKPESARGGVCISRLDPTDSRIADLTPPTEGVWDFRVSESPDGREIVFCRAPTGDSPTAWVMDADGGHARPITKGISNKGVDHPRWLRGK